MTPRIIHELYAGRKVYILRDNQESPGHRQQMTDPLPPIQAYVTGDQVAHWFWQHPQTHWSRSDFGVVRPPFDTMWIEWTFPPYETMIFEPESKSKDRRLYDGARIGALVTSTPNRLITRTVHSIPGRPIWLLADNFDTAEFDDLGHITEWGSYSTHHGHQPATPCKELLLILSMMNCKNVRTGEEQPAKALRQKHFPASSLPTMTTIHLPGNAGTTKVSLRASQGGAAPLHAVRGHFKTYTAEKPLFGKKTGTWWWSWHLEGDPKNGVRGHTYEVAS